MAQPYSLIRCNCGHPTCNRWQLSVGHFYQGTGFDPETAQLLAEAPRLLEQLKLARTALADPSDYKTDAAALLVSIDRAIELAENPDHRPDRERRL